jgi:uncharacterized protein YjbI with pentapeptide repeats
LKARTLQDARLERAVLYGSRLNGADLTGVRFDGAFLFGRRPKEAKYTIQGAPLVGPDVEAARRLSDVEGDQLIGASLDPRTVLDPTVRHAFESLISNE